MVKTVDIVGTEVKVEDLGGQNAAVKNLGSGSIYVSTKPNITAGADNVIEIPAGAGEVVLDANGTVYIVGTGKVQCTGTPYAVPNFKLPSTSSGGGGGTSDVTKEYVDAQDATNLSLAKAYTDNAKSEIQTTIDTVNDTLNTHIADQVKHITAEERAAWDAKAETDTATTSAAGLMSAADKTKLDGIAVGANNYVHPTNAGNKHIPSGGTDNQILAYSADGTAKWSSYSYVRSFVPILGHISAQNPTAEIIYQTGRNRCMVFLIAAGILINNTNPRFISGSRFIDFTNGADTTLDKTDMIDIDGCENPVYITIGKNSDGKCRILLEGKYNCTYIVLWYNM